MHMLWFNFILALCLKFFLKSVENEIIKSKLRIKLNHNIKIIIIHHFSGSHSVSKDILYLSTVLTILKHQVEWLYRPFLYVWGKVGYQSSSILLRHSHLVVSLDCLVIKVLAGFIPGHAITFLSQMTSFLYHVVSNT